MTDMQFGFLLTFTGGSLTLASLGLVALLIYALQQAVAGRP